MSLELAFSFDDKTFRHFVNGHATVLHCHHYMSLTTQLALKYESCNGPRILQESAEDAIFPMLESYCREKRITDTALRLGVGCEYFSAMGLGVMEASGDAHRGEVCLKRSHVDEGWIKKFGKSSRPINHFSAGFAAATFAAAFGRAPRSYAAREIRSIAMGDTITVFQIEEL